MVITRINPMSCAKVSGLLYAVIGFLVGACVSLLMMTIGMGSGMADDEMHMAPMFGALFGVGAIIMMPIFYGILGFVGGAIVAAVYNLIAGWTGGIEVDVR
jgi:hypothetical protein